MRQKNYLDLHRRTVRCNAGKSDNIREVDGRLLEVLRLHKFSRFQLFRHHPNSHTDHTTTTFSITKLIIATAAVRTTLQLKIWHIVLNRSRIKSVSSDDNITNITSINNIIIINNKLTV